MNNRYRNAPGLRGATKATASTLCQKCLKRDIYECTVSAQDRPYLTRPSRTQQLQNPKLKPKLASDEPNDLSRTKGLADDLLAKREEERGRTRDDPSYSFEASASSPRRPRSESSHSMNSVSTISTNWSPSRSPSRHDDGRDQASSRYSKTRKRRYSNFSPESVPSCSSGEGARSQSREWTRERNTRRRRRESSPDERGRPTNSSRDRGQRYRSRSWSKDRGQIARERRSMTPQTSHGQDYRGRTRNSTSPHSRRPRPGSDRSAALSPKERSPSPYSKRIALTQAMNMR